ncbi:GNAT family N-acetyltransferase [Yoonia sp. R2331]|uniref:GNAT family N-acetyltransferase n=1 Tax=Yoonia sp. R2331 TaxID=3237238 RepID=UPI0034E52CAC
MTTVRKIDADTVVPLIDLAVRPDQTGFVAPNAVTIAQAMFDKAAEIYGIYDGDAPVGLMAFIDMSHPDAELEERDTPDSLYLWRFMVDQAHQKRGHGAAALGLFDQIARDRGRIKVVTSAVPGSGSAIPFYERAGYAKTGQIDEGEVVLAKALSRPD